MTTDFSLRNFQIIAVILFAFGLYRANAQINTAQPLYYLGIFGAFNINYHFANFGELPGFTSCCPKFSTGGGNGLAAGAVVEMPLSDIIRLQTRVAFANISGTLTTPETIGNTLTRRNAPPFDTIVAPVIVEHRLASTLYTVGLEPTVLINITNGLFAQAGLSLSYLINAQADVRETIISPTTSTFLDGRAYRNNKSGAISGAANLLFSGIIGLSYELPIGDGKFLRPEMRYYPQFTNIADVDWKANTLQLGASLMFAIYPSEQIRHIQDTAYYRDTATKSIVGLDRERIARIRSNTQVETIRDGNIEFRHYSITENYLREIPGKSLFSVSVAAIGVETDGTRQPQPTIRIEEIETEEAFPLLPYVFYPENSGSLAKTNMILFDARRAKQFTEENLPRNTLDIYSQMLNIIGSRLKTKPEAKLIITGASNMCGDDGKLEITTSRSAELQQYFERVWGIESARISRKTRGLPEKPSNNSMEDGREENRRAELFSDDPDIFRPVSLREIERKATPPLIEITPTVQSDASVAYWNIVAEQSGEILREFSGSNIPGVQSWNLEILPQPKFETPVKISLKARNSRGEEQTAATAIKVQQLTLRKKRYEFKNDMRVERFALIVFDFNSSDISYVNRKTLEEIKMRITPESRVIIAGYADRTGELSYNSDLAKRRCLEAQKILDIPNDRVSILPVGSSSLLYDNSTPQGRSYSRTVQITIETPIRE